jgi:cytoskeletal protein RodZ
VTENRREGGQAPPEQAPAGARPESVGEYLATQRRLRGISLDELCERTKIPRRNLERLESGAFDARPDGFARGFVRAVALDLGLDADEAVMRLVGEPSPEDIAGGTLALGWLVRAAAVAALVIVGLLGWRVLLWAGQPGSGRSGEPGESAASVDPSPVTYRRDVVRSLANDAPPPAPLDAEAAAGAEAPAKTATSPAPAKAAPPKSVAPTAPGPAAPAAQMAEQAAEPAPPASEPAPRRRPASAPASPAPVPPN